METFEHAASEEFSHNRKHETIRRKYPKLRYVADGSLDALNSKGPHIRVHLDDVRLREQVWSKDYYYPGRLDDISPDELASIVAPAISNALQVEILDDEQRAQAELDRLGERRPDDRRAWRAYVKGLKHLHQYDQKNLHRAVKELQAAVELDKGFFAAHLALGEAYRWLFGYYEVPAAYLDLVVGSLKKAVELRPDSAEALSALGFTYVMAWKWEDAWKTLDLARDKKGDHALMHLGFAVYYSALGENELVKRSLRALYDNFDNPEVGDWGNWALFMVGEDEAARDWANAMMGNHPETGLLFAGAAVGAYIRGDHKKAEEYAVRAATRDPSAVVQLMLAQAFIMNGRIEDGRQKLREAESATTYTCWYETAATYALLDEKQMAMKNLQRAHQDGSNCLVFLNVDRRFKSIREDSYYGPEFLKLLEAVGLSDDKRKTYQIDRVEIQSSSTR
jgi:tetratricopeptide (TPR) repeat protein